MASDTEHCAQKQIRCDADFCRADKDGVIFYRDSNHLNTAGARYLGSRLNIPWPENTRRQLDTAELVAER